MNDDFFADLDVSFADFARRVRAGRFEPNADVYVDAAGTTLLVDVEIAGAEPAELRVVVESRRLYILGRRVDRGRVGRGSVLLKEIAYGDFSKQIHLPVAIAYDDAAASYRDGILTIRLPILEGSRLPAGRTEIRMTVRRVLA